MKAKKGLGQNFLNDKNKLVEIEKNFQFVEEDKKVNIIEVGPGLGSLTKILDKYNLSKVIAIEIDDEAIYELKKLNLKNTEVIYGNVLKVDFEEFFKKNKKINFVSNLPYYISTKIIFKAIDNKRIETISVMLQKELSNRIISKEGNRNFGRITVAVCTFFNVRKTISVPKDCFTPRPKVDSTFLFLEKRNEKKILEINKDDYLKFIKKCFANKRKTLINSLKINNFLEIEIVKHFLISNNLMENIRAEQISVNNYIKLWEKINKNNNVSRETKEVESENKKI